MDGHIHYSLKGSNYSDLRDPATTMPQYLFLYTLPSSRAYWITNQPDHHRLAHSGYFLSLLGLPELEMRSDGRPRQSATVKIPVVNRLSAATLLRLFRKACDDFAKLRGQA